MVYTPLPTISILLYVFPDRYRSTAVTVLLLRTPFGYLLASKGKSQYNLISASISILSLMVFIKPVIKNYGLEGVAWLSLCNLLFIGVFQLISYFYEVKKEA